MDGLGQLSVFMLVRMKSTLFSNNLHIRYKINVKVFSIKYFRNDMKFREITIIFFQNQLHKNIKMIGDFMRIFDLTPFIAFFILLITLIYEVYFWRLVTLALCI